MDGDTTANRMSGFESMMWTLDADPRLSSNVANLTMLDRSPDFDRFRRRIETAAGAIDRLHQRVASPPLGVGTPRWVDDSNFDIDRHLIHVDLKRPSRRRLLDEVMLRFSEPFDRDHPLWQFIVFDGLRDGRSAMLQRIHHTVTDGEGGIRISLQFLDFDRHALTEAAGVVADAMPDPDVSSGGGWQAAIGEMADLTVDGLRGAASEATRRLSHPGTVLDDARSTAQATASTLRQARLTDRRLSPLWIGRSTERRLDLLDIGLAEVRTAAKALGGTVNDVFVTAVAEAAGAYHRRHGAPVEALRMAMPISTRHGTDDDANHFSPSQTVVPTGEMSPTERFATVREAIGVTRGEPALSAVENFAGILNLLPSAVLTRVGVRAAETTDFVTSNLRAAPMDLFLAGALMESNHPIGPLATTAFNITTMSYRGRMWMGLVSDPAAIPDPEGLVKDVRRGLRDVLAAAPSS